MSLQVTRKAALALLAGAFLTSLTIGTALAATSPKDLSLNRLTDHGRFRVVLQSDVTPVPQRKIHAWRIRIAGPDGAPVHGAKVAISGGMPEHHHGLPTKPKVTESGVPGAYVMDGVRFSMRGWWVLKLEIRSADAGADTITFNLDL